MNVLLIFINEYGPNSDDKTFFELHAISWKQMQKINLFLKVINTVLEPKLDKMRGNPNTHIKRRETIQTALEKLI